MSGGVNQVRQGGAYADGAPIAGDRACPHASPQDAGVARAVLYAALTGRMKTRNNPAPSVGT
jgi:hypothetical protein